MEPKKRKITKSDWDKVEKHINDVYQARKTSNFRKSHEKKWKEVDRQVEMEPMKKVDSTGRAITNDWGSSIELGELSTASEIITSDVMRITFPQDKAWFQPHMELNWPIGQNGKPTIDDDKQEVADGLMRSLMSQQHKDFGFKARFRLSIKEALHHGSFVSEIKFEKQLMVKQGGKIATVGAPVWVPYSMWNAYPDPSPSVLGANMIYTGSMVLVDYMPLYRLKEISSGEGWIPDRVKKIEKRTNKNKDDDTEDIELVKYKGDISIDRSDGDIYLPNSEVILANGKLVYYSEAKLPYPNIIFAGYERQDVRDPYYTSPIIKQSPTQKFTCIMANEFIDATKMKVRPPVEYDANDPDYAANDGPVLAPGAKTATRSIGQGMKPLDIGDPSFALNAYTLGTQQMKEGLGVSANRAGVRDVDRETATAANLANQGAEVRTMEFISQLETQALVPFLYMQHELNRMEMTEYSFYNDEMHTPDFVRLGKDQIQNNGHFEVVGSRGVLGEERRAKQIAQTTAFFSGSPLFAPKLKTTDIMLEMFRDAGKKNPEEWVTADKPEIPPQVQQQMQQMQQVLQQLSEENKALKSKHQETMAKLQEDARQFDIKTKQERQQFIADFQREQQEFMRNFKLELLKLSEDRRQFNSQMAHEREYKGDSGGAPN